jgi:predicted alpha-1,6-mannanase (GH76 family)
MASRQTYLDYADTAAQVLTSKWYGTDGPSKWFGLNDFWRSPNLMTALTDLMQLTGSRDYLATANNALAVSSPYFVVGQSPTYYDDECWWGACFLRLAQLTGDTSWLSIPKTIFTDLQGGWDDVVGGGVWWKRDPKSYQNNENEKGSIENELYMDIAMTLYAYAGTGDRQMYLDVTNQTWQWMQALIESNGLVQGSLNQDGTINRKNPARPYNQGVILGPPWALYKVTGDTTYLDRAEKIVQAAFDTMTWPDGILRELCEKDGNCGPSDLNPPLFKGVFVRYLGEFTQRLATLGDPARKQAAQRYAAFLQRNADAVWANYPGPTHIFGMDWHTPQPNYKPTGCLIYDGCLQSSVLDLFVAAALVSQ